jgi:hypothetical protein
MQSDYTAHLNNKACSLTPLPAYRKPRGCKWVFRVKENLDGSVNKLKARLLAKGFHQTYGFDFKEAFYHVVKPATIQVILNLALTHKLSTQQIDISNAILNGTLEE